MADDSQSCTLTSRRPTRLTEARKRRDQLNLRLRLRRAIAAWIRTHWVKRWPTTVAGEVWSLGFIHDIEVAGQTYQSLILVDAFTRELLGFVERPFTGERITVMLEAAAVMHHLPARISLDRCMEFDTNTVVRWANERNLAINFSRPSPASWPAFKVTSFLQRHGPQPAWLICSSIGVTLNDLRWMVATGTVHADRKTEFEEDTVLSSC